MSLDPVTQSVDDAVDTPAQDPVVVVFSGVNAVVSGVIDPAIRVAALIDLDCFASSVIFQANLVDVAGPAPENTLSRDVRPASFGLFVTVFELFQLLQGGVSHSVELDVEFVHWLFTGARWARRGRVNSSADGGRGDDRRLDVSRGSRTIGVVRRVRANQLAVGQIPDLIFDRGLSASKSRQE